MEFITREQFDSKIKKQSDEELTKRVTKVILSNEDVLDQLRKAQADRDAGISNFIDDEGEFSRLADEVSGGRK